MILDRNIFLGGQHIDLRPLKLSDVEGNYKFWLNDQDIVQYNSHGRFPQTIEKLTNYVNAVQSSNSDLVLAVIDKSNNKHIGNISLQSINWIDRNAEIAFLLGEKEYMGKGIMFEAGQLLITHGFKSLNLHRIFCGTSSDNHGMQKLALKLGMNQEGVRNEAIFNKGQYFDIIEYGIINR
jgi:ribosomal-protein-alanine N-acetyltransferase